MDKVLSLYNDLNSNGVNFYIWDLGEDKAVTIELDGKYSIFMDFDNIHTSAEELVLVAHEGGHITTGATHRLNSPYDLVEKHEHKADKWAVQKLISECALDEAVAKGYTEIWDLAEYFGVTEDFMKKAVCYYTHGNLATECYF